MALTRKFLTAMGIDDEKIDEIIHAHRETVDALKEERDSYKDDAEKLPEIQKELDKAKQQIEEAEKSDEKDKWKVKYDAIKEEYDNYKSGVDAEKSKQKKSDAYRELLKEAGVPEKRIPTILRVTDLDKLEFDEKEGKIKDSDKEKENIKTEWADFIPKEQTHGADTQTPPAGQGGETHTLSRAAQVAAKRYEMLYGVKKAEEK